MENWPFADPKNVAVFTTPAIVARKAWIHHVSHDEEDGAWQFLEISPDTIATDAKIVALEEIFKIDSTIGELADLPFGWCAWRDTEKSAWQRKENI